MSDYHQEDPQEIEGYEEVLQKLLESLPLEERFVGLRPEERFVGLRPEERFIGLSTEERLLALPDEALRALAEDYLRTLSPATQAAIRQRIGRPL